jgi:general secretion pathway protein A
MYLQHFGLEKSPFSLTPDPRFLFLTAKHREALAALLFAVTERKGFMVLTGDAGTGKTTLVRKLLLSIPATCAQFSVIVNPALTRSELLESVLMDFGERDLSSSKALRLSLLKKLLLKALGEGKTSVLVIDEAHLLTGDLMDEVRLLSNFETSEQKLVQIILVGQNELNTLLRLDSMRPVKQRVAIRMHIDPLSEPEVKRYLQTRWGRACAEHAFPFRDDAIELIARASAGIPRVVNVICDAALVNAYGSGARAIGAPQIQEVLEDLGIALPNHSPWRAGSAVAPILRTEAHAADPSMPAKTVDRYMPSVRQPPKLWKIASWFRTAGGEAK